jgi:hypothetical protein
LTYNVNNGKIRLNKRREAAARRQIGRGFAAWGNTPIAARRGRRGETKETLMNKRPMLERMLLREKDDNLTGYTGKEKVKIGFVGLSAGAGVSLLTFSLARYIANKKEQAPAVIELSDGDEGIYGWNYDAVGIDRRFSNRAYFSFYKAMAEGRGIRNALNMDEGINWALRVPAETDCVPDLQQMTGLINNTAGDITLCDFSARLSFGERGEARQLTGLKRLLRDMTLVVCVVDPMPSKLLGGHGRLSVIKEVETESRNVFYVVNKYGRGVNKRELYKYLKPRDKAIVGHIAADALYEAEYHCKNPFQMPDVKRAVTDAIEAVLARSG